MVSPVNASRRPSRDTVHHSGSGRLANPYPMGDLHLLFFASKTGALGTGSTAAVCFREIIWPVYPRQPTSGPSTRCAAEAKGTLLHCSGEPTDAASRESSCGLRGPVFRNAQKLYCVAFSHGRRDKAARVYVSSRLVL